MNQTRFKLLRRGETLLPCCLTFHASSTPHRVDWFVSYSHVFCISRTRKIAFWSAADVCVEINFKIRFSPSCACAQIQLTFEKGETKKLNDNKHILFTLLSPFAFLQLAAFNLQKSWRCETVTNRSGFWHHFSSQNKICWRFKCQLKRTEKTSTEHVLSIWDSKLGTN